MRINFYRAKMLHLFIRTMPHLYYALNKYLWNERMKTSVEKVFYYSWKGLTHALSEDFVFVGILAVFPACLVPILLTALFLGLVLCTCSFHIMATMNK